MRQARPKQPELPWSHRSVKGLATRLSGDDSKPIRPVADVSMHPVSEPPDIPGLYAPTTPPRIPRAPELVHLTPEEQRELVESVTDFAPTAAPPSLEPVRVHVSPPERNVEPLHLCYGSPMPEPRKRKRRVYVPPPSVPPPPVVTVPLIDPLTGVTCKGDTPKFRKKPVALLRGIRNV